MVYATFFTPNDLYNVLLKYDQLTTEQHHMCVCVFHSEQKMSSVLKSNTVLNLSYFNLYKSHAAVHIPI